MKPVVVSRSSYLFALLVWLAAAQPVVAQTWQAAAALPTTAGQSSSVNKIVVLPAGGYVVAGSFTGTLALGSFVLTSTGDQDVFVARFSSADVCTQAVRLGGTGYDNANALAIAANGSVTVAGEFNSPAITIGNTTLTNASTNTTSDLFVARLTAAGQWDLAVRAGGRDSDSLNDLALDANGAAVVVGSFTGGNISFGSFSLTNSSTSGAFYVARLNSSGTWTQAVGAQSNGAPFYLSGVALTAAGTAVVCGNYYGGSLTLGSFSLMSFATTTPFVARLSTSGTWTQASQGTFSRGYAFPSAIALDASGNVAIIGNFREGNLAFGSNQLTYIAPTNTGGTATDNLFVARLSSAGTWTQAAQAIGSSYSYPTALALDKSGNIIVAGYFRTPSISFGSTVLTSASVASTSPFLPADVFVARLPVSGTWNYAIQAGGADGDYGNALALEGNGAVVGGSFGPASASFGSQNIATPAASAGFVAHLGGTALRTTSAQVQRLALVPSPARSRTTLALLPSELTRSLSLLDALGRPVRTYPLPAHATEATLDLTGLAPGLYVVRCGAASGRLMVE